jgi:hypothetical protein
MLLRRLLLLALSVALHAQSPDPLEIRGTIIDPFLNVGIPGVSVTLSEFPTTNDIVTRSIVATDQQGAFRFTPPHPGDFRNAPRQRSWSTRSQITSACAVVSAQSLPIG